ncbi:MAG TPA: hypothetical protein VJ499_01545 [Flavisolibacter sp.]|nr:hypothetical protein [Flavisolibacter sp.]
MEFLVVNMCLNDKFMVNYLLLRNGRLCGPFTLEALMAFGLQSSDQVRIDQEQTKWQSIFEVDALQDFLEETSSEFIPEIHTDNAEAGPFFKKGVSFESFLFKTASSPSNTKSYFGLPKDHFSGFEENRLLWVIRSLRKNPFTIAYVFIIVVCGTVVLKNIVDKLIWHTFPMEQIALATAAKPQVDKATHKMFQNALVREWVAPQSKSRKARKSVDTPQDIKKQLSIKSNNYKKGYFGGISELRLTINNASNHFVNEVEIEICYKANNGKLLETKIFRVESIPSLGNRTISIPPSHTGVKISYRILNIYSYQPGSLSKEI